MKLWILKSGSMENIYDEFLTEDKAIQTAVFELKNYSMDTYNHSMRAAILAMYFANALSLSYVPFHNLVKGALVHDIGKMKVPSEILDYQGNFNAEQRSKMEQHPLYGIEYFKEKELNISSDIQDIIIQHHEYCDGSGYPFGLHKRDISDCSRIITICDIFEAYITERVYHPRRSYEEGINYLQYLSSKGKIDAEYTKLFINMLF